MLVVRGAFLSPSWACCLLCLGTHVVYNDVNDSIVQFAATLSSTASEALHQLEHVTDSRAIAVQVCIHFPKVNRRIDTHSKSSVGQECLALADAVLKVLKHFCFFDVTQLSVNETEFPNTLNTEGVGIATSVTKAICKQFFRTAAHCDAKFWVLKDRCTTEMSESCQTTPAVIDR